MVYIRRFFPWLALVALILALLPAAPADGAPSIDPRFRAYYDQHQGMRVLGYPLSGLVEVNGYPAQYFEKGRIEDHRHEVTDPTWAFMYGRLTDELMERAPDVIVNATSPFITYEMLKGATDYRRDPPPGFTGGTMVGVDGFLVYGKHWDGVFIPYDAQLRPAPGSIVPMFFWTYMNRTDLFPEGWLHSTGLPMALALMVETTKNGEYRSIIMQPFERTVLTYDPQNPPGWEVERGNIGSDAWRAYGDALARIIDTPAAGDTVTLPLHILARVGTPGERITARLRWQDGTQLTHTLPVLRGEDGRGLLIGNMGWLTPTAPPATQAATLELRSAAGVLLGQQPVQVLGPNDPETREINVYWVLGERVVPHSQRIISTQRIGTAALNELLWGPPQTQIGFSTAIPTPQQVLTYPGREPDWGPRVTLRSLVIRDGVATADFSQELQAYGGGSLRVKLIHDQIAQTLLQFPTVKEVRIAIEGQTEGVLQP